MDVLRSPSALKRKEDVLASRDTLLRVIIVLIVGSNGQECPYYEMLSFSGASKILAYSKLISLVLKAIPPSSKDVGT